MEGNDYLNLGENSDRAFNTFNLPGHLVSLLVCQLSQVVTELSMGSNCKPGFAFCPTPTRMSPPPVLLIFTASELLYSRFILDSTCVIVSQAQHSHCRHWWHLCHVIRLRISFTAADTEVEVSYRVSFAHSVTTACTGQCRHHWGYDLASYRRRYQCHTILTVVGTGAMVL